MNYELMKVTYKGKKDCKHEHWVYSKGGKLMMTSPPLSVINRICEQCGRLETVKIDGIERSSHVRYMELFNKYHADS